MTIQKLDYSIVNNVGSWASSLLDFFYVLFALTENINNQRLGSFFDLVYYVVNVVVRNDG